MKKTILALALICAFNAPQAHALPTIHVMAKTAFIASSQALVWTLGYRIARTSGEAAVLNGMFASMNYDDVKKCVAECVELVRQNRMQTGNGRTDIALENMQKGEITQADIDALPADMKATIAHILQRSETNIESHKHHVSECKKWTATFFATLVATPALSYLMYRHG